MTIAVLRSVAIRTPSARVSQKTPVQTLPHFPRLLPVAVAWYASDDSAIEPTMSISSFFIEDVSVMFSDNG